ncbi:MAG: polysaccharide deacetylase family protein [Candidatus Sumerlaeaceae bacterium]
MSKLRILALLSMFVVIFAVSYTVLQKMPQWTSKVAPQAAMLMQPKEAAAGKERTAQDPGGRGATRDLSKVVESYRQQEQLAKAAPVEAADQGTSSASALPRSALAAPVRTPPPTLKIIREWPTGKKRVALTFDDGPHPEYTRKFLAMLAEKNVKATFFLLGPNVEKQPDVVREIVAAGHEVGNHSWSHPVLNKLAPEKIREELEKTTRAIAEASGAQVRLVRPPYGSANKKVQDICDSLGARIICWSIDTDDWRKQTTKEKMVETIKRNVRDGAIVLMHDRFDKSYETTAEIIDALRAQGYEFVTVGELLGFGPQPVQASAVAAAPASQFASSPPAQPTPTPTPLAVSSVAAPAGAAALPTSAPELRVSPEKITRPPVPSSSRAR